MLQKLNLTFMTLMTLKIKVTAITCIGILKGLWGSYRASFSLIALIHFELSHRKGCLWTDGEKDEETDRQADRWTLP